MDATLVAAAAAESSGRRGSDEGEKGAVVASATAKQRHRLRRCRVRRLRCCRVRGLRR
jgi:hypothetical protein